MPRQPPVDALAVEGVAALGKNTRRLPLLHLLQAHRAVLAPIHHCAPSVAGYHIQLSSRQAGRRLALRRHQTAGHRGPQLVREHDRAPKADGEDRPDRQVHRPHRSTEMEIDIKNRSPLV